MQSFYGKLEASRAYSSDGVPTNDVGSGIASAFQSQEELQRVCQSDPVASWNQTSVLPAATSAATSFYGNIQFQPLPVDETYLIDLEPAAQSAVSAAACEPDRRQLQQLPTPASVEAMATPEPSGAESTTGPGKSAFPAAVAANSALPQSSDAAAFRAWLLHVDPGGSLVGYAETLEEHYDTIGQVERVYTVMLDGRRCIDELFYDDIGVSNLEHQRYFEHWFSLDPGVRGRPTAGLQKELLAAPPGLSANGVSCC